MPGERTRSPASPGRSSRTPDSWSVKIRSQPAAVSASRCAANDWWSVLTRPYPTTDTPGNVAQVGAVTQVAAPTIGPPSETSDQASGTPAIMSQGRRLTTLEAARQPITRLVVDQAYDELPDIGAVEQHVDRNWELLEPFDDGLERLQLAAGHPASEFGARL